MKNRCFVFGSGEYDNISPDFLAAGYVIAADGGYAWLKSHGVTPNLLVGDFDSLGYVPDGVEILRHPPMKDDTDMALAVKAGIDRGFDDFLIYGGLGGRLDHTMGNIQIIAGLERRGISAFLISAKMTVTAISGRGRRFSGGYCGTFSAFAYGGKASGVIEEGCVYPLCDAVMQDDRTLGVSNEFLGLETKISVQEGTLIVMWQGNLDKGLPELYNLSDA